MPGRPWNGWPTDRAMGEGDAAPPYRADFAFAHTYRVRYRDIDPQGVVYFPTYLAIVNGAIHEYFRWLGHPYRLGADPERGDDFHIVRSEVDYRAPVAFDEDVEIGVRATRVGRSSLTLQAAIFGIGAPDDLRTLAVIVWVNTDQTTHRSVPLPEPLVRAIQEKQGRMK